jgi:hypothetical protein
MLRRIKFTSRVSLRTKRAQQLQQQQQQLQQQQQQQRSGGGSSAIDQVLRPRGASGGGIGRFPSQLSLGHRRDPSGGGGESFLGGGGGGGGGGGSGGGGGGGDDSSSERRHGSVIMRAVKKPKLGYVRNKPCTMPWLLYYAYSCTSVHTCFHTRVCTRLHLHTNILTCRNR